MDSFNQRFDGPVNQRNSKAAEPVANPNVPGSTSQRIHMNEPEYYGAGAGDDSSSGTLKLAIIALVIIGAIAISLALIFRSVDKTAQSGTKVFQEQNKLMREAIDMAREAQQLQRERMEEWRQAMQEAEDASYGDYVRDGYAIQPE